MKCNVMQMACVEFIKLEWWREKVYEKFLKLIRSSQNFLTFGFSPFAKQV